MSGLRQIHTISEKVTIETRNDSVANNAALAACSSTSVNATGGAGVRTTAAVASDGNIAALETASTAVRTGTSVKVPDDPRASLMFYLDCLSDVLEDFMDIASAVLDPKYRSVIHLFTDYMNYKSLGTELSDQLLLLCDILKPGLFIDKCFFKNPEMCRDSVNAFYKIEEVEKFVAVNSHMMVRGENRAVKKIMFFEPEFLVRHYVTPMKKLHYRLVQIQRGQNLFKPSLSEMYNIHLILSMLFPLWVVVWVIMCFQDEDPDSAPDEEARTEKF